MWDMPATQVPNPLPFFFFFTASNYTSLAFSSSDVQGLREKSSFLFPRLPPFSSSPRSQAHRLPPQAPLHSNPDSRGHPRAHFHAKFVQLFQGI